MYQCKREQTVGARANGDPFVGDRRITGAHRIDGHEFGAAALELVQPYLDRIRGVVFGYAPQHEIFGVIPVGRAEFPE